MPIFKVSMERIQSYDFIIEAEDDDEALDVASLAIEDIDNYDLKDDGWDANSHDLDSSEVSQKEIDLSVKENRFINAEEFFS